MAQVVLGGIGQALGGGIGRVVGSTLGAIIDRSLVAGLEVPRQRGPRLSALAFQGTSEGSPMAFVLGRARVTGHMIWAARFREGRKTSSAGKGGPRIVEYDYSLSFAVALCEGPIDGIGRIWADGQPMDPGGVTMRVHHGSEGQGPDPLIEAVEGEAPAYRGTAYVVFEDLPLASYGNRPPQLAFEVFRRPIGSQPTLEDELEGVCLIPGAGEFVLATEGIVRRQGLTRTTSENMHLGESRTDLAVSLDQLQIHLPNLKRVSLVLGWFGDDLRAGHCTIRPGVERRDKATEPANWSVAGLLREDAHLISKSVAAPAYGGTPSDESVRQAITELKARGLEVTLYPFVFMDVAPGNGLPDPYGGVEQAAYPWRGRLTGEASTAASDVSTVFGDETGWGLRRLALHYAAMAAECGAAGLLIGSEMRGLTWTRDIFGQFPAVEAFRALAAECRSIVGPEVKLSYAADWSEYSGWRAGADLVFHLDPLWADPNIDYVGIDWYPPLADWRDDDGGLDAALFDGPDDLEGLAAQIAGGEGFDWFYASPEDRAAQVRTPIVDTAHGEDWVFRYKDLTGWWSHAHHDRPGGVRSATASPWTPGMKPIRLTEFGCPAVDRGANAPNLFADAKSSEGRLPPFSTGARDDRMQRRLLEAVLAHFREPANNPVSAVYGGRMLEAADAWCWDARPWPVFPARSDIWADAGAWRTGHWLNGRLGGGTRNLLAEILMRAGLVEADFEIGNCAGDVDGYVIDRPMRVRDALEPLLGALGLLAAERDGRIALVGREPPTLALTTETLSLPTEGGGSIRANRTLEARPGAARVRFIDGDADYQTGSVTTRTAGEGGALDMDLPAVCSRSLAQAAAARALEAGREDRLTVSLGPVDSLALEPGDTVRVAGDARDWRAMQIDMGETWSAVLEPVSNVHIGENEGLPSVGDGPAATAAPFFRMIDLPPLMDEGSDARPVAIVAADPWRPMRVFGGPDTASLTQRVDVSEPAVVGQLVAGLSRGARHRWDVVNTLEVRVEGRAPENLSTSAVLAGGNVVAVETGAGWEIIQYRTAELVEGKNWKLTGLLRGQQGTDAAMAAGAPAGAVAVFLNSGFERVASPPAERGLPLIWRAALAGAPPGGRGVSEVGFSPTGLYYRPWSPAHLRSAAGVEGGFDLSWLPRSRTGGDRWDGEAGLADPPRYRVTVMKSGSIIRSFETDSEAVNYAGSDAAADFPDGFDDGEWAVAHWGESYGWGPETRAGLT